MKVINVYAKEMLGIEFPELPRDVRVKVGKLSQILSSADKLAEAEKAYGLGIAKAMGSADDVLEELQKFDARGAKIEDYLTDGMKPIARTLMYYVIKVVRSDGDYSHQEREAVRRAAHLLGVDDGALAQVEGIVLAEEGLRAARIAMLASTTKPA